MKKHDWHDNYVRSVMQHPIVAQQFINWLAPDDIVESIDLTNVAISSGSFIDKKLRKTFSDIILDCPFKNSSDSTAKIIILIEHQSTAEKLLPIRIHHYMLNILESMLKEQKGSEPLPAIYPIIYYNGKTKHYPYSTKLRDCIYGPQSALNHYSVQDIQVVNVNAIPNEQAAEHQLAGIMTNAMKRTTKTQTPQNYQVVLEQLSDLENNNQIPQGFTESTIRYMMNVKTIDNLDELIERNQKLPETLRGEAMTIAEAFELRGEAKGEVKGEARGEVKGKVKVAITMLEHNMPVEQVAELTGLDIDVIIKLSQDQDKPTH